MTKKRRAAGADATRARRRGTPRGNSASAPIGARRVEAVTKTVSDAPERRAPFVVAVLNSNQDVLRLIRAALEDEGYTVATEHIVNLKDGDANLGQFLANHRPAAVVYDMAPPYKENWNFLQLLREIPEVAALPMVLTTVNKAALEKFVGRTDALEILGTRNDLAPLVDEINRAVRSRREPRL